MAKPPIPTEMQKTFDAQELEQPLYHWWETEGLFKPTIKEGEKPFVVSMPPPNVTGALHLGHAITSSVEDCLIRYRRLTGQPTLWVPGSDHAGIATQNVVERELAKEGVSRHDLGREAFVDKVWEWKDQYHARITEQQRRLGISCDWERERFTLDEGLSKAVREAFVRLYEDGLIYRGAYLVNWCPRCGTAISDLEVEHEDRASHLWYVRYDTADGSRSVTVATTRPETILGDTAVAVNPEDERYADLIGTKVVLPVIGREIPIIADPAVEMEFGTGAVKVTPAHDPTDYEIGQRHKLPMIDVMNDDMTMNAHAGPYEGQDRFECRENLVDELRELGNLVKIEDYTHSVGGCQRCATIVEPRISTQWFVKMKPLAEPAIEAVRDGRIRIVPQRFERIYYNWLENIRDWCVSRQLWWGHRIPVWYCDDCGEMTCAREDPTKCSKCGSTNIRQEEDVLDTWFSSGLWPFSTLGWPERTEDLAYFYPTAVMETGYDIIFFWVARMIMLGLRMTGEAPFDTVYLHGLVRNEAGKKISKSMEDAWRYDPLFLIDEYGQDPLRFTLLTGSTPGNDMKLAPSRVEANRNFGNKIWQAARFTLANLGDDPARFTAPNTVDVGTLSDPADRWIVSRYHKLAGECTRLIEAYQLGEAGRQMYEFVWSEFCDWYIEMTKVRLRDENNQDAADQARQVLVYVLEGCLRLLHPYMPFLTETIWQYLPHEGKSIMIATWPGSESMAGSADEDAIAQVDGLMELVRGIRNARTEYDVQPGRRIAAQIAAGENTAFMQGQAGVLCLLARIAEDNLEITQTIDEAPDQAVTLVVGGTTCYLPLAALVDLDKERERIQGEIDNLVGEIARSEKLLANQGFVSKAPEAVVQKERDKVAEYQTRLASLQERLADLG